MRAAPERVLVADRSVVVSGPPGYCIDRALSRARDANAFVMLGSCAAIANSASKPAPPVPAILTVSVSPPLDVALRIDALRRYLDTQAGRAALSRGGDPAAVEIMETRGINDVLFIHARDRDTVTMPGVSDTYWRALFALNGRLITASAVGVTGEPITSAEGYETLRALVFRMRRENDGVTVSTRSGLPE